MNWFKVVDNGGAERLINFAVITNFYKNGATSLVFDEGSSSFTVTFSSTVVRDEVFTKLESILQAQNINSLAPQS